MWLSDNGLNTEAAIPGLSLTPTIVTLASFLVEVIPVMIWSLKAFLELVIRVPFFFTKEDLTIKLILFN